MSDETTVVAPEATPQAQPDFSQRLTNSLWGEPDTSAAAVQPAMPAQEPAAEPAASAAPSAEPAPKTDIEEEILDPNAYLKNKWGWENEEQADNEIKQLREKAEKAFEYKNEESKKIAEYINEGKLDELYQVLDTKRKVQKLSTADLSDKNVAAELVKFGIQRENPNLSLDEVDFVFNEKYSIPSKPSKDDFIDEDEYNIKLNAWQTQVSNIEKRMIIDAKMAQPKIAQMDTELVIPNINKEGQTQSNQPSPEELEEFERAKTSFLQLAKQTVEGFNGFSTQVKDKDVDYSVSYAPSQDERKLLSESLSKLADSGFNANTLFAERWYDIDAKTFKVDQMTKDLSRIFMGENVDKKLAEDAANKRLEAYLAEKKNVNLQTGNPNSTFQPTNPRPISEKLAEQIWGN